MTTANRSSPYAAFVGLILLVIALVIPFARLEQSRGDILPLIVAVAVAAVAGIFLVLAYWPRFVRAYLLGLGVLAAVVLTLAAVAFVSSSAPHSHASSAATGSHEREELEMRDAVPHKR